MTYAVEFEEETAASELATVGDCIALARRLDELAGLNRPVGAYFYHPNGESLLVVLGAAASFLAWFPTNYAETALGSLSSAADVDLDMPIDYWHCGHHGQICPENAVSISTMFTALEQFLCDSGPPGAVGWIPD